MKKYVENVKEYVENKKEYVGNMKEYVRNMKGISISKICKNVENMKDYERICQKYEGI